MHFNSSTYTMLSKISYNVVKNELSALCGEETY